MGISTSLLTKKLSMPIIVCRVALDPLIRELAPSWAHPSYLENKLIGFL